VIGSISIDPKTTALLDFQTFIVDGYAAGKESLLARTARLLDAAHDAEMTVIYVVVGFRPGFPEVSARNMSFRTIKESGPFAASDANAKIHPAVAPKPGDTVVTKHRVSAFAGTDLDMILRANGIETLLLTGITTSGVVLSTLRHATDADYRLLVVSDCCSDRDAEVHRVLVEKVLPPQALVASADDVIGSLSQVHRSSGGSRLGA
jgi:nicotinamidase-related amidase